jgi:hypothetical protein
MILKNFLPQSYADELENVISAETFPWFFNGQTNGKDNTFLTDYHFTHDAILDYAPNSNYIGLLKPVVWFFEKETGISVKRIFRIKVNLTTNAELTDSEKELGLHFDVSDENFISLLYYVSDSDGDTLVKKDNNDVFISPEKNKAVWFKSNTIHRTGRPEINKRRLVINFILEI